MNQTFSISRFGRLLWRYFTDNQRQLLVYMGLLIIGLFVLTLFTYQGLPNAVNHQRQILFFLLGWPCWYVFTVQQTAVLSQKERAINYLMQPASQLEKILLIWLISGIGFIVVYLSVFYVFDAIWVSYTNNRDWSPEQLEAIRRMGSSMTIGSIFSELGTSGTPAQMWVFTVLLHPFVMAFSLLVRQYTLPLVVVIAFALLIFGCFGNNVLLHALTGSESIGSPTPFSSASAISPIEHYQYRRIEIPQPIGNGIRYTLGIVVVILLYVTAYFRLKEREV
ncbi:hypothetical protein [Spirosoma validum]|uniref:Uncharacterized protein n=1 Tax=Spirosoma validum TaxID=2771355 RepID=A0A927GDA9_9BACT|nr:hypothetical protein [Spirosoma validum]MBD2753519.1 hypothetical protein [Spirosoma validum]